MKLNKILIIWVIVSLYNPYTTNANQVKDMTNKIEITANYIAHKNRHIAPFLPYFYAYLIHHYANEYNIKPKHLTALISIESTFYYYAESNAGCIGLGQINPKVWTKTLKEKGIIKNKKDLFTSDRNIEATAYILKHYYNKGIKLNKENPLKYALNRYLGDNSHYKRFIEEIRRYNKWLRTK